MREGEACHIFLRLPLESVVSPSMVNRLGKNRCCCSGPNKASPSRSTCSEIHNTCSGANRSQQWGHVTWDSSLSAAPVEVESGDSIPTALVIAVTAIDQEVQTRGIFSDEADPRRVTSDIARYASISSFHTSNPESTQMTISRYNRVAKLGDSGNDN
jgi:hypothetical protein